MRRYDKVLIEVQFWRDCDEKDYCEIVLPEGLEYRFSESSRPTAVINKKFLIPESDLK